MAYIGKTPITGNFVKLDAISVVNGQAGYTMNNGGSAFTDYENVNQFLVSLNGILQAPTDSFTVSGSTLTFASNLATGDVIDFVIVLGNTLDIGTPSDATVTQAKTNFVSTSSSAGLQIKGDGTTDGTLQLNCSQNSHGIKLKSPSHASAQSYTLTFPTTAPSSDKALITDGSGNLSFGDAGGTNTPSFLAKQSGVQSISASTITKLNFQTEIFDTDSKFDNSTNYRFTPATAGKYFIFGQFSVTNQENAKLQRCYIYKNGSFLDPAVFVMLSGREEDGSCAIQIIDQANTTDYYELYAYHNCSTSKNTVTNSTFFGAYKIIE
jgi:hypothetical protein